MKADIHPKYNDVTINCSCGNSFVTREPEVILTCSAQQLVRLAEPHA